jgi:acyl-coenzyme A synthetase/AMP-(fatty) acid ligase
MTGERPISTFLTEPPSRERALAFGQRGARDWQRFADEVGALAGAVRRRGAGHWLIASDDAYEVALGLLATLHAGAVAVLPANLQPGHLADIAAGVTGVLTDEPPPDCRIPVLSVRDLDVSAERLPFWPLDPGRAEVRLHTSGTTGAPLTVVKPLRCLEAEVAALDRLFTGRGALAVLATVPPYHIYGLLFRVLWPLAAGRVMARDTIRFPGELTPAVRDAPEAILVSSPAFLKRALPMLDLADLDPRLRGVFSSGGPLPPEVAAAYNRSLAHPVVEVYGSTETGGIGRRTVMAAAAPPPWTPLPGVTLALDPGSGVLMVSSPFLPEPGWHRTGDLAELLPDGSFELCGRADRIVKIEERRISLPELERRLNESPDVAAARVLQLPAGQGGRPALGAVVLPTASGWQRLRVGGKDALRTTLLELLRPNIDGVALPRRWRFVRRLPESAQGKTSDAALVALFDGRRDGGRAPVLERVERADGPRLTLRLSPDLRCFDGHFDGAPILAGVVQLDWAIRFARERFALAPRVERIEALKFYQIMPAGALVELELSYDPAERWLQFRYLSEERVCSAGRIQLQAAP